MTSDRGVIYIATGDQYIEEAIVSARSLKKQNNDIKVTIFSDGEANVELEEHDFFDEVVLLDESRGDFGDSIIKSEMLRYDRTLFIDTDTYICGDISDTFEVLDNFDVAAAHNPGSRTTEPSRNNAAKDVPETFPLYNTGVISLSKSSDVERFLKDWMARYNELTSQGNDYLNQPAFREALYESDLRIATLPTEYNCRIRYRGSVGFLSSDVKIIHGRHPGKLSKIAHLLNNESGMRVFTSKKYPVRLDNKSPGITFYLVSIIKELAEKNTGYYTFLGRFVNSLKTRGITPTLKKVVRDIQGGTK